MRSRWLRECWVDGSGAATIITPLDGSHSHRVGDIITVSVKNAIPKGKVKKGDVYKAIIVRTKKEIRRKDGS